MPLPDDDRRALAARLATTAPGAVDAVAEAVAGDEELREVLVDTDGQVVALTSTRALYADGADVRSFDYGAVDVRRRDDGLGIDARLEGDRLVLDVARSTFVRLGVVAQGGPPGRATWLPVRAPEPRPEPPSTPLPPEAGGYAVGPPIPPDASPAPPGAATPAPQPASAPLVGDAPVPPVGGSTAPPSTPAAPVPPPPPPTAALPPPGWHPDPSGRHWWRWWDGQAWTQHVADGGAPYVDPTPPR